MQETYALSTYKAVTDIQRYKFLNYARNARPSIPLNEIEFRRDQEVKYIFQNLEDIKVSQGMVLDTQDFKEKLLELANKKHDETLELTR